MFLKTWELAAKFHIFLTRGIPAPQGAPGEGAQPTPLLGHPPGLRQWEHMEQLPAHLCPPVWRLPVESCVRAAFAGARALKENVPAQCPSVRLIWAFERSASHLSSRARRCAQAAHKGKCFKEIIHSAFLGMTPELPAWCSRRGTSSDSLSLRLLNESWRRLRLPAHNFLWLDYHPWKLVEDWRV